MITRQIKSNDLGALLESGMQEALTKRKCLFWRLHTIRSWKGVSNPCDFIILDEKFTALIECKATLDDKFSCSAFRQLPHFEKSAQFAHIGHFGVVVYFHSETDPRYVYVSDKKVIENKKNRRPIRVGVRESYDIMSKSLKELLIFLTMRSHH